MSVFPPAVTPAETADDHTAHFKFPTILLVSELGSHPKPKYISAMEHLFPFNGGGQWSQTCSNMFLFFCPATLYESLFWESETRSWQSTRCHFNEASWCHDNAAGCALLQDGQHWATFLGRKQEERHQLLAQFHFHVWGGGGVRAELHAISKCETAAVGGTPPQITEQVSNVNCCGWFLLHTRVFPWLMPNALRC